MAQGPPFRLFRCPNDSAVLVALQRPSMSQEMADAGFARERRGPLGFLEGLVATTALAATPAVLNWPLVDARAHIWPLTVGWHEERP